MAIPHRLIWHILVIVPCSVGLDTVAHVDVVPLSMVSCVALQPKTVHDEWNEASTVYNAHCGSLKLRSTINLFKLQAPAFCANHGCVSAVIWKNQSKPLPNG
jgi:hypothetical protein